MPKKIIPIIVFIVVLVGGYIGFKIYDAQRFLNAVTPHIKNTSLRVINAARFETEKDSKITYKELLEKIDGDVAEIDRRLLEIQTISTTDTKEKTDPIVEYLKASQEFLRSLSSKYKKELTLTSAIEWAKQRSSDFWNEPGYNQYALKASRKASDDEQKAIVEYKESIYGVADAIGRLDNAKGKIVQMAGQDALVTDSVIEELKKKNPTKEQDEKQKEADIKQKATDRSPLTAEELAKQSNCNACHDMNRKIVGPAYKTVSKKYLGQSGASEKLAAKIVSGGGGVWGAMPMPRTAVTPEEASKLATWILGLAK